MPKVENYLSEEQLKAIQAVQKLNNELYDKYGWENHIDLFNITISSHYFFITFNINTNHNIEIPIYNSTIDDRMFYAKSNKYEEWYSYIKRKFRDIKYDLNNIKI